MESQTWGLGRRVWILSLQRWCRQRRGLGAKGKVTKLTPRRLKSQEKEQEQRVHPPLIAVEGSSSDTGRAAAVTLWEKGQHPTLGSTPAALGSFASLTALCSSGIHTPYVSTQSCNADWVNGFPECSAQDRLTPA